MSALPSRLIGTGVLFIFIFLSGVWLSNAGRPLNVLVLTIHKLMGLGTAILFGVTVYQINQQVGLNSTVWIAVAITLMLFLATIISGGLSSLEQPAAAAILAIHKIGPFLTVLSTVASMYLLVKSPA